MIISHHLISFNNNLILFVIVQVHINIMYSFSFVVCLTKNRKIDNQKSKIEIFQYHVQRLDIISFMLLDLICDIYLQDLCSEAYKANIEMYHSPSLGSFPVIDIYTLKVLPFLAAIISFSALSIS